MWALRRSSVHLRCLSSGTTRIGSVKSEIASFYLENCNADLTHFQLRRRFHNTSSSIKSFPVAQFFSSLIGAKSSGDHKGVLEDAASRLETRHGKVQEAASGDEMDDESITESGLSVGVGVVDDIQNENEILDTEADGSEQKYRKTEAPSGLTKFILSSPSGETNGDPARLDEWVEAGNEVTRTEVSRALLFLKIYRLFFMAFQLMEWLESRKHLEFTESEYASRVDLTAKVRGLSEAEKYIRQIPESFRSEIVYVNLLKNCASATNVTKAEKLFEEMKSLFPLTFRSYNQMLFLYKRVNRKKIVEVLSLMKKENIKSNEFTYQILIDLKGQSNNISEMEQIFEAMKHDDGVEPSLRNQASVARYYALAGLKDKAEAVLKDMEGGSDADRNRYTLRFLLPVYALLGRNNEVGRIWNECRSNPDVAECIAAIKAWGLLNRIEDAEAAFDELLKIRKSLSAKHYAILLTIYADHGMLAKGEDLLRRMTESGVTAQGKAWDAAVKLYIGAGELEKAHAVLEKAIRQRRSRPQAASFLKILGGYARRGDVHNAEKIFFQMKQAGYAMQLVPYQSLLFAYIHAKAPAYGFDMRLKSDGVVPDELLSQLLARVDEFRKTLLSQLLARVDEFRKTRESVSELLS